MKKQPIKIVCISDSHRQHWRMDIPDGDILLFAGDAELDSFNALQDFNNWLGTLNFKHIVVIGGNHDMVLANYVMEEKEMFFSNAIYLENTSVQIEGIKIFGSPYSLRFFSWAFMKSEKQLEQMWELIPKNTDIVLTHSPCRNILDVTTTTDENCGSFSLRNKIKELQTKIHICGHLHSSHGKYTDYKTDYYNVSMLNDYYQYIFEPTVIYYEK